MAEAFSYAANRSCRRECPDCAKQLQLMVYHLNLQIANATKHDFDKSLSADLYTIVMLCIFAGIILLLMVRAIKPSESVDDQVTLLLSSLRVKCEIEDNARQKKKLREAKKRAQKWLAEAKAKSAKKLSIAGISGSFRVRSTSDSNAFQPEIISLKSNPALPVVSRQIKPIAQRAVSYQFLPEIVVTTSQNFEPNGFSPSGCFSGASSSCDDISQESCKDIYSVV